MEAIERERKRAWKAEQRKLAQAAFPIVNELLESLFESVDTQVEESGCDHTLRYTSQWIAEHSQPEERIVSWLKLHGGFCDCEVVANALDHWEQNR